jgi:hypothetical protein
MTECSETLFPFEAHFSRQVVAQFEGSWLTTEGGSLLLRQADRKIGLLGRVARCFTDYRQPERIEHRLEEMLAQRIYGLALGYEDLNDHEQLRQDPLLGVLAGKRDLSEPLAGKSTLNRLELTPVGSPAAERLQQDRLLFEQSTNCWSRCFWSPIAKRRRNRSGSGCHGHPTCMGKQEARFFHGYYNHYCYLNAVLYIFCGDLPVGVGCGLPTIDGVCGSLEDAARIVTHSESLAAYADHPAKRTPGSARGELGVVRKKTHGGTFSDSHGNKRLRRKIAKQMLQDQERANSAPGDPPVYSLSSLQTRKTWSRRPSCRWPKPNRSRRRIAFS